MQSHGSILAIGLIPSLIQRRSPLERRNELLVGNGQCGTVIRHGKPRQRLIFDVRRTAAIAGRKHQPEVVWVFNWRMFGIGSSEKLTPGTRVGSENVSDRIIMTVLSVIFALRV